MNMKLSEAKDSAEHLEVYVNIIKEYLKKKGILDFTKFQLAISHDKPLYVKWEYPTTLEKPTVEYLLKEFKIDLMAPRKIQKLEFEYIYIHATGIASKLLTAKVIKNKTDPIFFNILGDAISPYDVSDGKYDISKTTIETILKIDLEKIPNIWQNEDKLFMSKVLVENGLLKFYHQDIYQGTNGNIRVLVAYQKTEDSNRSTEMFNPLKTTSSSATKRSIKEALKSLNN
jgi:hypothetical protein